MIGNKACWYPATRKYKSRYYCNLHIQDVIRKPRPITKKELIAIKQLYKKGKKEKDEEFFQWCAKTIPILLKELFALKE